MRGAIAHGHQGFVGEIAGEAGDETETREIGGGFVNFVEQIGEGGGAAVAVLVGVVVDRLAEQRDFACAGGDEFLDFFDDVFRGAMNFRAAGVGDDAVGAEFVAAAGDADVGLGNIVRR